MADSDFSPSRHRHAQPLSPRDRRRRAILIAVAVAVAVAITALLVLSLNRSSNAAADRTVALTTTTTPPASPPAPPPAPSPAPTAVETVSTPGVPGEFTAAMEQIGIPLDPNTGWAVAQGICVRLGQPEYDEFSMSEGVERLFPSVPHEQAHEFVAMVAESVCHL